MKWGWCIGKSREKENPLEDPENLAIVQGILGLTTAFQREVIAEGVETKKQYEYLKQISTDISLTVSYFFLKLVVSQINI